MFISKIGELVINSLKSGQNWEFDDCDMDFKIVNEKLELSIFIFYGVFFYELRSQYRYRGKDDFKWKFNMIEKFIIWYHVRNLRIVLLSIRKHGLEDKIVKLFESEFENG